MTPRYLRFARAIALTSSLGGATAGCYSSHEIPGRDAGARDARVADVSVLPDVPPRRDAPLTCADCACVWGPYDAGAAPSCDAIGLWSCCAVIGPAAPPDLPA